MADLSFGEKMYKISLQHFVILESQGLVGLWQKDTGTQGPKMYKLKKKKREDSEFI